MGLESLPRTVTSTLSPHSGKLKNNDDDSDSLVEKILPVIFYHLEPGTTITYPIIGLCVHLVEAAERIMLHWDELECCS